MSNKLLDLIKESEAKWVDFRFTDTRGKSSTSAILPQALMKMY